MKIEEAKKMVRELNITEDEESLTFKAAVILLYGMTNNTAGIQNIKKKTDYCWKEVAFIMNNFWANGIIVKYSWQVEIVEDDLHSLIEITCCAMAGAGELIRKSEGLIPDEIPYSWSEYCKKPFAEYRNFIQSRNKSLRGTVGINPKETPSWLIEKQRRIKEVAAKFDNQNTNPRPQPNTDEGG